MGRQWAGNGGHTDDGLPGVRGEGEPDNRGPRPRLLGLGPTGHVHPGVVLEVSWNGLHPGPRDQPAGPARDPSGSDSDELVASPVWLGPGTTNLGKRFLKFIADPARMTGGERNPDMPGFRRDEARWGVRW